MSRTLLSLAETTAAGNVKLQAAAAVHEGLRLICLCLHRTLTCLMSVCRHYDWGLRAIKSVLVVAGSLLRAQEGQVESDVLFRALRDFNIPKILSQDMVIFTGLLQDLFPAVDPPRKRDIEFEKVHIMLNAFCFLSIFPCCIGQRCGASRGDWTSHLQVCMSYSVVPPCSHVDLDHCCMWVMCSLLCILLG